MRYFVTEQERKASYSSCYYEFQRGSFHDRCWEADSISIHDDVWDNLRLTELFGQVLPFNPYGPTPVNRAQWILLKDAAASVPSWKQVVEELSPWVRQCFETEEEFTILGL